jgi:hypothetical protein
MSKSSLTATSFAEMTPAGLQKARKPETNLESRLPFETPLSTPFFVSPNYSTANVVNVLGKIMNFLATIFIQL